MSKFQITNKSQIPIANVLNFWKLNIGNYLKIDNCKLIITTGGSL